MVGITCNDCGRTLQIGDWPFCGGRNDHGSVFGLNAQRFDPIVVHRSPDGQVSFPGRPDAPIPQGYEKVELRTVQQVRTFEHEMNRRDAATHEDSLNRRRAALSKVQARNRSELRAAMNQMSAFGREFARLAMAATDARTHPRYEAGGHFEVFSHDSSNREPHVDKRTGWKEKRA